MRVLVTGGAGFVGSHVAAALAARGDAATILDPAAGTGSVLDPAALAAALRGADAVIHCAACAQLWQPDPGLYTRLNVGGTAAVLAAARARGLPAVHVSSYTTLLAGPRRPERTLDETLELPPEAMLGPYPRSKREAEIIAAAEGAVIVLPTAPVGPGDRAVTPPTRLLRDLAARRLPALLDCTLNLIDVRALAAGILAALDRGAPGRRYLLAGEDLAMDAFAHLFTRVSGIPAPRARVPYAVALAAAHAEALLARLTGRPPQAPLTGVRLAGLARRLDASRARTELGFTAPPVEDALRAALREITP